MAGGEWRPSAFYGRWRVLRAVVGRGVTRVDVFERADGSPVLFDTRNGAGVAAATLNGAP